MGRRAALGASPPLGLVGGDLLGRPRRVEADGRLVAPFGEAVEAGQFVMIVEIDGEGDKEIGAAGWELGT